MNGAWAWLQFHNAPWEGDSQFWGVSLAAIAVGSAPGNYKAEPAIQPGLKRMRVWLQREMDRQTPLDRVALLWASAKLPTLLSSDQQKTILRETLSKQRDDGSFSTSDLIGAWKRKDGTPLHSDSDGYATGLVAFALEQLGTPETKSNVDRAVTWLRKNQNAEEGRWPAYSLNKERELISDAGRFMSDAATAYAVLAIANVK
jgi:squalene-hopene/tetraprenyl-beta-curcumene cyclase